MENCYSLYQVRSDGDFSEASTLRKSGMVIHAVRAMRMVTPSDEAFWLMPEGGEGIQQLWTSPLVCTLPMTCGTTQLSAPKEGGFRSVE